MRTPADPLRVLVSALTLISFAGPGALARGTGWPGPSAVLALSGGLAQEVGASQDEDPELERFLAEARADIEQSRRAGRWEAAQKSLGELLSDEPLDWQSRAYQAALERDRGDFEAALKDARRVQDEAARAARSTAVEARGAAIVELSVLLELGRFREGLTRIETLRRQTGLAPGDSAAFDGLAAELQIGLGQRAAGIELRQAAAAARPSADRAPLPGGVYQEALFKARALRALGELGSASNALVATLNTVGADAELLAELAAIYFEADGEVADARTQDRNPGPILRKALELNPRSESALLGLFELFRFNWRRQSQSADSYLNQLLEARPATVAGRLAAAGAALELSQLDRVRKLLGELEAEAPGRREVQSLRATVTFIEAGPEAAERVLAPLLSSDPADSLPERTLGSFLVALYRFSEARPVLEAAVERDPGDYAAWAELGQARANVGDIQGAREALERSRIEARLRRNAERNNLALILKHIDEDFTEFEAPPLTFAWQPLGSEVLELYWPPFYERARLELVERYGFDPGRVRIEVFEKWADFSVRSTGFEGFPALGVCFGPVVTAVSPLAELRGTFSWARTGFHEFTHVIHLGLSHNRCPRWITEGLATWEEVRKRPSWTRNMRRDLIDARANGDIFPLRELNGAFRGPRVVFGYYQGGLLCELLIDAFGFPSMLRLLDAFDRGADLDQAMEQVFGLTPEEIDRRFLEFVDRQIDGLAVEPQWRPERAAWLRLSLAEQAPTNPAEREAWAAGWCTVAWSAFQGQKRVDAETVLSRLEKSGIEPLRALALRGHLCLAARDPQAAQAAFGRLFEAGGEDFFGRLALAEFAFKEGDQERAIQLLERAEAAFPGFAQPQVSAELALARTYQARGQSEEALAAKQRWLDWNADALAERLEVARALATLGRHEAAAVRFEEAVEIDPFLCAMHRDYALSLLELGRFELALRESRAAQRVPLELDGDQSGPLEGARLAELLALEGRAQLGLKEAVLARALLERARAADPGQDQVRRLAKELGP